MRLNFLKNYFYLFGIVYLISLFAKFIFIIYLAEKFSDYTLSQQIYAIFWGYRFDFALSGFVAFFVMLFDFNKRTVVSFSLLSIFIILVVQASDMMYFFESSRHSGYEVKDAFVDSLSVIKIAIFQHTAYMLFFVFSTIGIIFYSRLYLLKKLNKIVLSRWTILQKIILLLFSVFFIRGTSFVGIPLTPWNANQIGDVKLANISLNASYNILFALTKNKKIQVIKLPFITKNKINRTLKKLYQSKPKQNFTKLNKPNVVFFFLESWSGVYLKPYGFDKQVTPFFDEILKKSIRPKGMIAGGHRTSEGVFASLTSLQNPLGRTVAQTKLQNYSYDSIVNIFNNDNYYTAFYQGTSKETSGNGSFAQKLGFKNSFGKRDIKLKQYAQNSWGVQDPDLYKFVEMNLDKNNKPFFIGINGATTHDDVLPKEVKSLKFSENIILNKRLNALNFADKALSDFFNQIKSKYPNTLFVFFADHVGSINGNSFENYLIPFAIYHQDLKAKYYDIFSSQRDIAPTILDLVYGDYQALMPNSTGKSLVSDSRFFADYYDNGILGWVKNDKVLELNLSTQQKRCYQIIRFKLNPFICDKQTLAFSDEALAFTTQAQQLLFSGKTQNFNLLRKQ